MKILDPATARRPAGAPAHEDPVRPRVLAGDEPRTARQPEAAPLADREEPVPAVGSDLVSRRLVHDRPRPVAEVGGERSRGTARPEKADALTVPAVLRREPQPGGEPPDLGLPQVAHRNDDRSSWRPLIRERK